MRSSILGSKFRYVLRDSLIYIFNIFWQCSWLHNALPVRKHMKALFAYADSRIDRRYVQTGIGRKKLTKSYKIENHKMLKQFIGS